LVRRQDWDLDLQRRRGRRQKDWRQREDCGVVGDGVKVVGVVAEDVVGEVVAEEDIDTEEGEAEGPSMRHKGQEAFDVFGEGIGKILGNIVALDKDIEKDIVVAVVVGIGASKSIVVVAAVDIGDKVVVAKH
jgi:hypothetical protein